MMNHNGRVNVNSFLILFAFVMIFIWLPAFSAMAEDDIKNTGISLGLRGTYYHPNDGDASWYGGAQARFHLSPMFALEGSIDYRRNDQTDGTKVQQYPVLASVLVYLFPGRFSPFLLGGAGWYFTHTETPVGNHDESRFGVHAGAGLEIYLNRWWSIDGTYRYVWVEKVQSKNAPPFDKEFNDNGHMITAALNYHF